MLTTLILIKEGKLLQRENYFCYVYKLSNLQSSLVAHSLFLSHALKEIYAILSSCQFPSFSSS